MRGLFPKIVGRVVLILFRNGFSQGAGRGREFEAPFDEERQLFDGRSAIRFEIVIHTVVLLVIEVYSQTLCRLALPANIPPAGP